MLGVLIFIILFSAYAAIWNVVVAYDLVPNSSSTDGLLAVTTVILTTSTFTATDSNQTSTTVTSKTVTANMCPAGATSCTGVGERMDVIVNRPIINTPFFRFSSIPVYWTRLSGTWIGAYLLLYHQLYSIAIAILIATWTTLSTLDVRRKLAAQPQRRLMR